ncbi:MAG: 3-hydroxybutyryl-CoA dehydrogenase [Acidobacteria bacterium]|nr:3-hydroxybutyryl-CoA dehydrogenase [Acidobacteriota bacterium]MBI3658045.1 3-hydroxybutyryl-CoA dehydrogenase [Acidobacteriota bacterium]
MEIKKVAVIGAGTMGNGIAQVAAQTGMSVILQDIREDLVERGLKSIQNSLEKFVAKSVITADQKREILSRIFTTTNLEAVVKADIVIEAVTEAFEVKRTLWQTLDQLCRTDVIFASNTSSISITRLAAQTRRPDRFIGMHFFNPVPLMKLVEVVRGLATSTDTSAQVHALAKALGKTPVEANDFPGFISNRILIPMINESIFAVMEGVGSPEAIDAVMKLGMNHPMGPLALADFIGLDVCLSIMDVLYDGFNDPKYRPCPLLKKMVDAGYLGKKSGQGFYRY